MSNFLQWLWHLDIYFERKMHAELLWQQGQRMLMFGEMEVMDPSFPRCAAASRFNRQRILLHAAHLHKVEPWMTLCKLINLLLIKIP